MPTVLGLIILRKKVCILAFNAIYCNMKNDKMQHDQRPTGTARYIALRNETYATQQNLFNDLDGDNAEAILNGVMNYLGSQPFTNLDAATRTRQNIVNAIAMLEHIASCLYDEIADGCYND